MVELQRHQNVELQMETRDEGEREGVAHGFDSNHFPISLLTNVINSDRHHRPLAKDLFLRLHSW